MVAVLGMVQQGQQGLWRIRSRQVLVGDGNANRQIGKGLLFSRQVIFFSLAPASLFLLPNFFPQEFLPGIFLNLHQSTKVVVPVSRSSITFTFISCAFL